MPRIPLFPLDLVVYPGEELPLHLFEERYLLMLEEALATGTPIGIALARPDQAADRVEYDPVGVGTAVDVVQVQPLEEGRRLVLTRGQRRFRVLRVVSERPFQEADVEWLDEDVGDPAAAARAEDAVRAQLARVGAEAVVETARTPVETAYAVASAIKAPLSLQQRLLEASNAEERLKMEAAILRVIDTGMA